MTAPILLAGGGTGGHVFPLVALAEAFAALAAEQGRDLPFAFVGTARGLEARVVPARGWTLETLAIEPMKGRSIFGALRGGMIAGAGVVRAMGLVRRLRPRLCVSIGGYAAGPVAVASATLGVPLALLEPNRVAGLTQRLLAPLAKRIYVGFPEAVTSPKARALGIPLRAGFSPVAPHADGARVRVLVMGGSQGAQFLNERLPGVFAALARGAGSAPLEVVHQAGRDRGDGVRATYARVWPSGSSMYEVVEFIDDVRAALAAADLVVCRSGAMTCAELCAVGRPAVLIPYPFAADDHQAANAEALAGAGAAVALRQSEATEGALQDAIGRLVADRSARVAMADAARARGVPDAARRIAEDLLALSSEKGIA